MRFTNGSSKTIPLDQVVVTVVYGPDRRLAAPVYLDGSQDFGAIVKPGGSATANYSFSIPSGDLDDVTMYVDFDGLHGAATFHGKIG